jgi:hypothetical protein
MSLIGRNATSLRSRRAAVGALLRLGFVVLPCCVFAGLGVVVRRRLTGPSHGPTTIHYHIMGSVVHHSKFAVHWQLWVIRVDSRRLGVGLLYPR